MAKQGRPFFVACLNLERYNKIMDAYIFWRLRQ